MELIDLARMAYQAYDKDRGGKNHLGQPNPKWEDLPQGIRHAWAAALVAVKMEINREMSKVTLEAMEAIREDLSMMRHDTELELSQIPIK